MARPSKLKPEQWVEIERRVAEGESISAIAREFKLAESTVRERVSAKARKIKNVANQIVKTEQALAALPISARLTAVGLSQKLLAISVNLATAAELGTGTSVRLAQIANEHAQAIDDADPTKSKDTLMIVDGLTKMSNEAAKTGLNLLAANKGTSYTPTEPTDSDLDAARKLFSE